MLHLFKKKAAETIKKVERRTKDKNDKTRSQKKESEKTRLEVKNKRHQTKTEVESKNYKEIKIEPINKEEKSSVKNVNNALPRRKKRPRSNKHDRRSNDRKPKKTFMKENKLSESEDNENEETKNNVGQNHPSNGGGNESEDIRRIIERVESDIRRSSLRPRRAAPSSPTWGGLSSPRGSNLKVESHDFDRSEEAKHGEKTSDANGGVENKYQATTDPHIIELLESQLRRGSLRPRKSQQSHKERPFTEKLPVAPNKVHKRRVGRPRKCPEQNETGGHDGDFEENEKPKRKKVGRPRKHKKENVDTEYDSTITMSEKDIQEELEETEKPKKKKRGRPRKYSPYTGEESDKDDNMKGEAFSPTPHVPEELAHWVLGRPRRKVRKGASISYRERSDSEGSNFGNDPESKNDPESEKISKRDEEDEKIQTNA